MALRFCWRVDRRQAILGMLAAGVTVLPVETRAVPSPNAERAYAAFFLGQGGYLFSWGIPLLASEARKLGLTTDVFSYSDVNLAWESILRKRREGYKIALVGYSLGNTTATYLQSRLAVDLLLAIAESSLGRNHPIRKENTKRSVLWHGPDTLSSAGVRDGFDETIYIENSHLLMDVDPRVVRGVLDELRNLVAPERREKQTVAANVPVPKRSVPQINNEIATRPAPPQLPSTGWLPPINVITPDVTCTNCWGFAQSLGGAGADPWIR
jgi:hypothetical protein